MKLSKEKMWRSVERVLKRTKRYQKYREFGEEENYKLAYVLIKGGNPCAGNIISVALYENDAIQFWPFTDREEIDLWGFNFERDLFEYLESGYEIVGMTAECHYDVWSAIEEWGESGIDNKKGMQKYLAYCKRHGVSKEELQKEADYSGMDVMTLYNPKADRMKKQEDLER